MYDQATFEQLSEDLRRACIKACTKAYVQGVTPGTKNSVDFLREEVLKEVKNLEWFDETNSSHIFMLSTVMGDFHKPENVAVLSKELDKVTV